MHEKEDLAIKVDNISDNISDVKLLKKEGINHIQNLSGSIWTDYNIHDPGITILEILCFALTELGYRSKYPIQDLIQPAPREKYRRDSNFPAHEILTSSPITELDFKNIILDLDGINNIEFLESKEKIEVDFFFDIYIELENQYATSLEKSRVESQVRSVLNQNRFLCTQFNKVYFFEQDSITLDIEIELTKKIEASDFLYQIVSLIEAYFSPSPQYNTLSELLDDRVDKDQIYNGPLLNNGFAVDFKSSSLRKKIYTSDVLNILMSLDGVKNLKKLELKDETGEIFNWIYNVKKGKVPRIDIKTSKVTITYKGKHSQSFLLKDYFSEMVSLKSRLKRSSSENILSLPVGNYRDLKEYHSITNDFPDVYGLGKSGMPEGASELEESASNQLRVYLMFFDQIMANYFAQLDNVKELFSIEKISTTNAVQVLEDFPGIQYVYKPFLDEYMIKNINLNDDVLLKKEWKKYVRERKNELTNFISQIKEDQKNFEVRRNRILDHLLARFGYNFNSFDVLSMLSDSDLIGVKLNLLQKLVQHGSSKSKGVQIVSEIPERKSGFESYIYSLLGLAESNNSLLTKSLNSLSLQDPVSKSSFILSFKNRNKSVSINELMKFGSIHENYSLSDNGINLMGSNNDVLCNIAYSGPTPFELEKLIGKIYNISRQSEGFYMIEHNLICPSDEMRVYGFCVILEGVIIFSTEFNYSRIERDQLIDSYLKSLTEKDYYKIEELDSKQYKLSWSNGTNKIYGTHFFNSIHSARLSLNDYLEATKDDNFAEDAIKKSTKFSSFYNEIDDPFSNIISFIFPTWPHRFQNEAFKNHIFETITLELPAHIISNYCWFDFEEMQVFEKNLSNYLNCPVVNHQEHLTFLEILMDQIANKNE